MHGDEHPLQNALGLRQRMSVVVVDASVGVFVRAYYLTMDLTAFGCMAGFDLTLYSSYDKHVVLLCGETATVGMMGSSFARAGCIAVVCVATRTPPAYIAGHVKWLSSTHPNGCRAPT